MDSDTGDTTRQLFFNYVCPFTPALVIAFSIALLFALVSVGFVLLLPPGSGSRIIALLTIAINTGVMVVTGYLIRVCGRRRNE